MPRMTVGYVVWFGLMMCANAAVEAAPTADANPNMAESGELTLRRNVLFVGGKTLASWRSESAELFELSQMKELVVASGRTADMLVRFRRAVIDADVDLVHIMPEISAARAEGMEQMQQNISAMVDIALANGKRVVLARPLDVSGNGNSEAEESIATWMQQQALDRGLGFGDYRHWPFAGPLRGVKSLGERTEALQTALDDAFRVQARVTTSERFARYAAWQSARPDQPGSGPYPAIRGIDPALPSHTFYRPANLVSFKGRKLPVLLWANGGCGDDSAFSRPFLTEVASHGYLVIALGAMKSGPGGEGVMRDATSPEGAPTSTRDLLTALDWVSGLSASQDGWKEYADTANVAAAGYSCGSSLAMDVARDKRLRTAIALNGGVFRNELPGLTMSMTDLSQMHAPLLYVLGGPTDVAYHSAMTNLTYLDHVPVVLISREVGHSGTYWAPNGGSFAGVTVAWLDWHLKGRQAMRGMFVGGSCELCTDPNWMVKSKGF